MGLLERISRARTPVRSISTIDDYMGLVNEFMFNGVAYQAPFVQQSMAGETAERIPNDLVSYAQAAYASNGPVFSCMLVRQLVFSAVRFRWQRIVDGKPSDLFGTPDLGLLERPFFGGTTQDLLNRVIQYADLGGNAYTVRYTPLARLGGDDQAEAVAIRPDWTEVVLTPRRMNGGRLGWRKLGYLYYEGGAGNSDGTPLLLDEVSHFAPIPDPLASFRGMSWLTPVIRELQNDKLMQTHQRKFFENAATSNMVIKVDPSVGIDKFRAFRDEFEANHAGVHNAWKNLYLGGGADASVIGTDFDKMRFTDLSGASETRIASAAGVPPIIAGFSKGLESATYSNYGQARRRFADGTMHPLWQNAAGSLEPLVRPDSFGAQVRLWYDATDVPFLREDEKDHAEILQLQANTIASLVREGYTHDSVVAAVEASDWRLLRHTGLYSVQLQPPGTDLTTGSSRMSDRTRDVLGSELYRTAFTAVMTGTDPGLLPDEQRRVLAEAKELTDTPGGGYPMPLGLDPTRPVGGDAA